MSIVGILASNLFAAGAAHSTQNSQNNPSKFQQIKTEFQQLGEDLRSGNLRQARSDFATLSQDFPPAAQSSAAPSSNLAAQAFTQLGQDLQSGNLQAAQKDFANLQQDLQQESTPEVGGHGRRQHSEASQSSSSVSQQAGSIVQAFSSLSQDLQAGNLSGAQSAFTALTNDLQQIGGFLPAGSIGTSSVSGPANSGRLNVTA